LITPAGRLLTLTGRHQIVKHASEGSHGKSSYIYIINTSKQFTRHQTLSVVSDYNLQ